MKNSLCCPKCESRRLWKVDQIGSDNGSVNAVDELRVAVVTTMEKSTGLFGGEQLSRKWSKHGYFSAYICARCGYSELWAHALDGLTHSPRDGVHLVDTTPQHSEYR